MITTPLACGPLELGAWIDDRPSLVLERRYLDAIRALPLTHVAVMIDGPRPGLEDQYWRLGHLEQLRRALPDHERVLTVWAAPQLGAIEELGAQLPELVEALGASAIEVDTEPVGEWALRGVRGFRDEGGDKGALDEASDALAQVLAASRLPVEVTVFPGALRNVRRLLEALVRELGPDGAVRLVLQAYPVRTRGPRSKPELVEYSSALGPERLPRESILAARAAHPGVELVAGLAAYDQRGWPGVAPADAMHAAVASAVATGCRRIRWWSVKHIVRLAGRKYAAPAIAALG